MAELDMPDSPNGGYRPLPRREFIVELADDGDRSLFIVRPDDVREAIVRCKDCASCNEHPVCGKLVLFCHHFSMCDSAGFPVEPEGFCKWGEARDGA